MYKSICIITALILLFLVIFFIKNQIIFKNQLANVKILFFILLLASIFIYFWMYLKDYLYFNNLNNFIDNYINNKYSDNQVEQNKNDLNIVHIYRQKELEYFLIYTKNDDWIINDNWIIFELNNWKYVIYTRNNWDNIEERHSFWKIVVIRKINSKLLLAEKLNRSNSR